ncbi:MAG: phospholipid carrier-dependent glycosyltransferase [Oscillospiraceae bacterium]|nr:phospholipid carrier-dependent glycosyltransferase [Oscillospiraceae bacterium]
MPNLTSYLSPTLLLPMALILAILAFFAVYWRGVRQWEAEHPLEWIEHPATFSFQHKRWPMERKDALLCLLITAVYGATAFFGLGSRQAPESFAAVDPDHQASIVLDAPMDLSGIWYYSGLNTGDYGLWLSYDGENFTASCTISQKYNALFKWHKLDLEEANLSLDGVKMVCFTSGASLELGEVALFGRNGGLVSSSHMSTDKTGAALVDEQDTVPERISYLNSTYFDEIYHPRTAYEHLRGVYPYEVSHPPLGKLILSVGIALFGMNPFGWRFMGTLFGVLMLPILYVFLKNLFGRTAVAASGTLLFAFDFMHFVQTRIATIDTYGVFFILLSFFFLYRYFTVPEGTPFQKEILPLFLCGLFWGIGCASKWTVIYAGAGLALLYFWNMALRLRRKERTAAWAVKTIGVSVIFFVVIPLTVYYFSYLPYGVEGRTFGPELVWDNQVFMLTYHNGVHDEHPYSSRWWQWVLNARPILYYLDSTGVGEGLKSAFGAFGNPAVVWGGLLALPALLWAALRRKSGRAAFLLVGYFVQLVPWMVIGRTTFEYHYFPSILFLVLALAFVMDGMLERGGARGRKFCYGAVGVSVGLFVMFYPVLSGIPTPVWYTTNLLKWFPSWPF